MGFPPAQGLYDPRNEHDACGVGFIANIKGAKTHSTVERGLQILVNLDHRGAVGADPLLGDGAGILVDLAAIAALIPMLDRIADEPQKAAERLH